MKSFALGHHFVLSEYYFFFNDPATTEIYTLSLHDALPISSHPQPGRKQNFRLTLGPLPSPRCHRLAQVPRDRKSTRLNSSHITISYAVFCLKKKKYTTLTCMP